ncbi:hypothetical protein DFJ75_3957 [Williamsia muralis]|uniref:Uncharacterized protein n=2 Tax=Williamsia marianensis TaxID=85044 RepID=A0A495K704_WILMA|nr:hypothetical protein DFJ75_3957 [Williamsia muralis]
MPATVHRRRISSGLLSPSLPLLLLGAVFGDEAATEVASRRWSPQNGQVGVPDKIAADRAQPDPTPYSVRMSRVRVVLVLMITGLALVLGACGGDSEEAESTTVGSVNLPQDFPDQVPLIEGSILAAGGTAQEGWNLTVAGKPDAGNPFDNAGKVLTDAGFTEEFRRQEGGQTVVGYGADKDGKRYTVVIGTTAGSPSGPTSITYLVSQR